MPLLQDFISNIGNLAGKVPQQPNDFWDRVAGRPLAKQQMYETSQDAASQRRIAEEQAHQKAIADYARKISAGNTGGHLDEVIASILPMAKANVGAEDATFTGRANNLTGQMMSDSPIARMLAGTQFNKASSENLESGTQNDLMKLDPANASEAGRKYNKFLQEQQTGSANLGKIREETRGEQLKNQGFESTLPLLPEKTKADIQLALAQASEAQGMGKYRQSLMTLNPAQQQLIEAQAEATKALGSNRETAPIPLGGQRYAVPITDPRTGKRTWQVVDSLQELLGSLNAGTGNNYGPIPLSPSGPGANAANSRMGLAPAPTVDEDRLRAAIRGVRGF